MSSRYSLNSWPEDQSAFYIPEDLIAHLNPGAYMQFKISEKKGFRTNGAYTNLTNSIYEKTGLLVMLIHCHRNLCSIIGSPLKDIDYIECNDGKKRIWGTPSFNTNALLHFCEVVGKNMNETGMRPVRWTSSTK